MKKIEAPQLLFGIIVLAALIRLINLDYLSLWVDEYVHVLRAKDFIQEGASLFTNDNNGILLTIFITPFFLLFEANEFWARLPSVLFGLGSIYMIFKLGKSLFNQNTGLFAAVLLSFSQYHVFWSRVARNYTIFMFFMLVCFYLIHQLYKTKVDKKVGIKTSLALLFTFILALLSHNLSFFLIFGYAFYIITCFIHRKFISKQKTSEGLITKFNLPLIPSILLFALILVPFFGDLIRPILTLFLPPKIATWVIPDWDHLSELWKAKPYKSWNLYLDVLKYDFTYLYFLGAIGFGLSLFKNTKSGLFLISFFIPILLLMSFIFREPLLPRYLIGIYPIFLIAIAVSADSIFNFSLGKIFSKRPKLALNLSLLILILLSPISDCYSLVTEKKHGRVIPKQLSHWNFANWKEPVSRVKKRIKKEDVVLSTNFNGALFYLDLNKEDQLYSFRQRVYDVTSRKYVPRKVSHNNPHAQSLRGVMDLYRNNDRGWLFADYYFENVMTDPKTRQFIIQNLEFHYGLGNEFIKVFSWDKSRPLKYKNHILEEIGRDGIKNQSLEYGITIPENQKDEVTLFIEAQGLDFTNELFLQINKKTLVKVDPRTGNVYKKNKNRWARQTFSVTLKRSVFKKGQNSIMFKYNPGVKKEKVKGCVIYRLNVGA
mgnify:CR=1 FL=1